MPSIHPCAVSDSLHRREARCRRLTIARALAYIGVLCLLFGCTTDVYIDDGDAAAPPPNIGQDIRKGGRTITDTIYLGDTGIGVGGVDILLVVDNDPVMETARTRLSTALYSLISQLLHPFGGAPYIDALRLAVITSDMGLQYGRRFTDPVSETAPDAGVDGPEAYGCDAFGDNAQFMPPSALVASVPLEGNDVPCELYGEQCPSGWYCDTGTCAPPTADKRILCAEASSDAVLQTLTARPDVSFASKAACLLHQPPSSCVIRQPLEAVVKALKRHPEFIKKNHLLLVMVLSGRDDCSIADPTLFETDWTPESVRIACFTNGNDAFLYSIDEYHQMLLSFKDDNPAAVLYAAVVGAPDLACDGTGLDAYQKQCVLNMALSWGDYQNEDGLYYELYPACQFQNSDPLEDSPKFGRRLIELATRFGNAGYVQSMCNPKWDGMVNHLVSTIRALSSIGECRIDAPLDVHYLSEESPCPDCAVPECTLFAQFVRTGANADDVSCPLAFVYGNDYGAHASFYRTDFETVVFCPIRNIPAPIDCGDAEARTDEEQIGWYYCRNGTASEGAEYTCADEIDNDRDGLSDCEDDACKSCLVCGDASGCPLGCAHEIVLTPDTEALVAGQSLFLDCPILSFR